MTTSPIQRPNLLAPSRPAPGLLAIGGAHVDRRGRIESDYVPAASNPGTMREDVGGVVFNALRTAIRRGVAGSIASLRGGDATGETIAAAIAGAGVTDLSATFLDRTSASYTAIIDREGDLVVGFADMGLYDLFARQIRRAAWRTAMQEADAILSDANLPQAALEGIAAHRAGTPLFSIGISPAKVVRLRTILADLACLFLNRKEAVALTGSHSDAPSADLIATLRAAGLASAVITDGARPAICYDGSGVAALSPPAARRIADVTGAGDALAGATVAAIMRGMPLPMAAREGLAAAMLALETEKAVPAFSEDEFSAALARVAQPQTISLE